MSATFGRGLDGMRVLRLAEVLWDFLVGENRENLNALVITVMPGNAMALGNAVVLETFVQELAKHQDAIKMHSPRRR